MLTSLPTSLLLISALLFGDMVVEPRSVSFQALTVPRALMDAGYTPAVVQHEIHNAAMALVRDAQSNAEARQIASANRDTPIELLATYLGVGPVLQAVYQGSGLLEYSIAGGIVQEGNTLKLRLTVTRNDGRVDTAAASAPVGDVDALLRAGGWALTMLTDPQIACSALLRRSVQAGTPDIVKSYKCVQEAMGFAGEEDRPWLNNLGGVICTLARDLQCAVAHFSEALRMQPDFSPALLNLGMLLAMDGRDAEAIRLYALVFRRRMSSDSPQTNAATYVMWARSLEKLGQPAAAVQKLREATRADPNNARAARRLLEHLPAGPEAQALRVAIGRMGEQDEIYTDNILGVLPSAAGLR